MGDSPDPVRRSIKKLSPSKQNLSDSLLDTIENDIIYSNRSLCSLHNKCNIYTLCNFNNIHKLNNIDNFNKNKNIALEYLKHTKRGNLRLSYY